MNLAILLIFSYTQLTHSNMSPFADATGLITFALAGCKLTNTRLLALFAVDFSVEGTWDFGVIIRF